MSDGGPCRASLRGWGFSRQGNEMREGATHPTQREEQVQRPEMVCVFRALLGLLLLHGIGYYFIALVPLKM